MTICIYHADCSDGFGAAWVVNHFLGKGKVSFHAASYNQPPPDVTGNHVIIVDFSYPADVLVAMSKIALSITLLDHHKTAEEALSGVQARVAIERGCPVYIEFDKARSGARMAWDYYAFDHEPPPALLRRIEDRDLWKFNYADTKAVTAALYSYPMEFQVWDELMARPIGDLALEGAALLRDQDRKIAQVTATSLRSMMIGGVLVPVVNCPGFMYSEVASRLAVAGCFAACYTDTASHRRFSLRSTDAGVDVSEIAKLYGGGGHRNAAGFEVPRDHPLATE